LYCFLRYSWPQMKKATNILLLSFQKYKTGSNEKHFPSLPASNKVHKYFLVCYSFLCYPVQIKNSTHGALCCLFFIATNLLLLIPNTRVCPIQQGCTYSLFLFATNLLPSSPHCLANKKVHMFFIVVCYNTRGTNGSTSIHVSL
jgi:hypothetical protein